MTDELRSAAEALKVAADRLAAAVEAGGAKTDRSPRSHPRLCIAWLTQDCSVGWRGDVVAVRLPLLGDGDCHVMNDDGTDWIDPKNVDVICPLGDALKAWEKQHP